MNKTADVKSKESERPTNDENNGGDVKQIIHNADF